MTTPAITPKIWAGLILIVVCVVAGAITAKFYGNYSQSRTQSDALRAQNSELSQGVSTTSSFLANYLQKQPEAKTLNLVLPANSPDMSNFVSNLGEMAQSSGVLLSGFQVNELTDPNKPANNSIRILSIALTAAGTYPSLKDFVLRLESNQRLIDITHIGLSSDENASLQYRINFLTYYQK